MSRLRCRRRAAAGPEVECALVTARLCPAGASGLTANLNLQQGPPSQSGHGSCHGHARLARQPGPMTLRGSVQPGAWLDRGDSRVPPCVLRRGPGARPSWPGSAAKCSLQPWKYLMYYINLSSSHESTEFSRSSGFKFRVMSLSQDS